MKNIWQKIQTNMETSKKCFKKGSEEKRREQYRKKKMQSEIYKKQDKKFNIWLQQNLTPKKHEPLCQ